MKPTKKKIDVPADKEKLENFDIHINEFGEIVSSKSQDEINEFLDKNLKDKKSDNQNQKEDDKQ